MAWLGTCRIAVVEMEGCLREDRHLQGCHLGSEDMGTRAGNVNFRWQGILKHGWVTWGPGEKR